MGYYWNNNEEVEFKHQGGRLYLWVIHRDHSHNGLCPHVHILDLSGLNLGQTEVERDMNYYCGKAHREGRVERY